ncbi:MAG: DegV family protein [Oscillospiraceae bacterium]|jgi:DegV family protein with EDD domain|nr:DegV family protein [Oscillospiraceae bacterium]
MENKKIAIITDSACDIPDELLERYGIHYVPLRLIYRDGEVRDRVEISPEQVYAIMSESLPKTSLPLPEDVTSLYDRLADEGYTDAIHICISSGLSGTYNMVRMLAEEYTRLNVRVVDTKSLSMQEGLVVLACARKLEETGDIDEVIALAQTVREKSFGMFVIRTLEYLRKGGRIGLVEGVLGTMLQLKPVIFVNQDGIYETLAKARGYANALEVLVREVTNRFNKSRIALAVIHGAAPQEGAKLLERLKGLLNIEESFLLPCSPVLGVHTGPGLLGVIAYDLA